MAATNINIRIDSEVKSKAQKLFSKFGLDMTTAVNLFLRQSIRTKSIPFPISDQPVTPSRQAGKNKPAKRNGYGCLKGKIRMAPDFDAPLEDFKEYM
jgi:DNA-damage-inducible protein J